MMFTHDDIEERLIDFLYGDLDAEARAAFDAHIDACDRCRSEVRAFEQTRATARAVVRAPLADAVPAAVRARVLEAASRATAERTVANKALVSKPGARDPRGVSRWSAWFRARWTLPMFATVAAMGALLLVRETIFREAHRPLGANPPGELSPKPEPAILPAESPVPAGTAGEQARPSEVKGIPARRLRGSVAASSGKARLAETKREEHPRPAKASQDNSSAANDLEGDGVSARFAEPSEAVARKAVPVPSAQPALAPPAPFAAAPRASSAAEPSSPSSGAAASAPDPAVTQVERAAKFMATQRWNDAIVAYRDLLRRFPRHASVPVWRRQLVAAQAAARGAAARDNSGFATPPPPR